MDPYPDDGLLPGIEDCIIQDNEISADSDTVFLEETAGFKFSSKSPMESTTGTTSCDDRDAIMKET
jgi:hypothetical protein